MDAARMPRFALASGSPRRRQLLEGAGFRFVVRPSHVAEPDPAGFADVAAFVSHAAWVKARAGAELPGCAGAWVLAADTVAEVAGEVLGKPADRDDARRMIGLLMGSTHRTWTGVCLWLGGPGVALTLAVATGVTMRRLEPAAVERYLDSGAWVGKAAAYGIQHDDDPFVSRFDGSWSNVVGLPMERLGDLFALALRADPDPAEPSGADAG